MSRQPNRTGIAATLLALASLVPASGLALEPGDCDPADLEVLLDTGLDQSTGSSLIPTGDPDDDWDVTLDASGGRVPADAEVIDANPAWETLPGTKWISAAATGPNGIYRYETCWCMDDDFANPVLDIAIRADDQADLRLNGNLIASLPDGTFNDPVAPSYIVTNPALFVVGQNCLEVEVENKYGVVTGFNMQASVTADDGLCCGCDTGDLLQDCASGVDDETGALIYNSGDDDTWTVTAAASGGTLPRPAEVTSFSAWSVLPGTKWITADKNGPNGVYTYEKCWCMSDNFSNAQLDMQILADNEADVYLNGNPIGSTPPDAFVLPATNIFTNVQAFFKEGQNCVTVDVTNTTSVVTGLNVDMTITADDGECCPCVDIPTDAVGWWPLDETSGIVHYDIISGNDGFHDDWLAMPPPPTPGPGMVAGALEFDGTDDYVRVPNDPLINFGLDVDFSIDAWVKTPSNIRQAIVHKKDQTPGSPGYSFHTANGWLAMEISDGPDTVYCLGPTFLNDDQWHFVAVTVDRDDPAGLRLWLDGTLEATCDPTTVTGNIDDPGSMYFGGDPSAPPGAFIAWLGFLDEIEIFRRALTPAEVIDLYRAGHAGKCPLPVCEDSAGLPTCEGLCPDGQECVFDGGFQPCDCVDHTETCGGSLPECDGLCPDTGDICVEGLAGCECVPEPQCEGTETYPECNGACPNTNEVCVNNGDDCHCVLANPCSETGAPVCQGNCPDGISCTYDADLDECFCPIEEPLPCEGMWTHPECDGWCHDPTDICWNNGQRCHCIDEAPVACNDPGDYPACNGICDAGFVCEDVGVGCDCVPELTECSDSEHPVCNGLCPVGQTCDPIGAACGCVDEPVACEDTFYPSCNGDCPAGQKCKNVLGSDECFCEPIPPACGDSIYPTCGGICPIGEACIKVDAPVPDCVCEPCVVVGTGGGGIVDQVDDEVEIAWPLGTGGKNQIRWSEMTCAHTYNVYRQEGAVLTDGNDDGLADDYGDCYIEDIIGLDAPAPGVPPPGSCHWYLVTGENSGVETTLGENSDRVERPNLNHCP